MRSELSWTHYRLLLRVENQAARDFYAEECLKSNWSTRQLERQINSFFYERLLASRDKDAVRQEILTKEPSQKPQDFIRDPYVLEFLDVKQDAIAYEKDLETALIGKLQKFLLELGRGFAFVSRQKHIDLDGEHFFINTAEEIKEAFQPFYQETQLEREVNTDLLYHVQKELRGFAIYSDDDIDNFIKEYYRYEKQDSKAMGRLTSSLQPVAERYNKLDADERFHFRFLCRNMIKWYGYISQIVRMFDKELHKEYEFLRLLFRHIPEEPKQMMDLEGKLELEYYRLEKTFDGAVLLNEEKGVYSPASAKSAVSPEEDKPLDEIIERINEQYKGKFTEADKVLITTLRTKLMSNKKLASMARTSDPQIFTESIFPKAFGTAAQDSYIESQDTYASLFEDQAKYNAIMHALGSLIYRELRK